MRFEDFARAAGKAIGDLSHRVTPPQFAGLRVSRRRRATLTTASSLALAAILVAGFVAFWPGQSDELPLVGGSTSTTSSTATTSTTATTVPAPGTTVLESTTTTTTAATTSTSQPTTTTEPAPLVVLASDGLGIVQFGADPQTTIATITAALGSPDEDSGWVLYSELQPGFGVCGGSEWRLVRWGQLGVLFTDEADSDYAPQGQPHFAMYGYTEWVGVPQDQTPLRTPAGLTLGATKDQVLALYDQAATYIAGDEIVAPYVRIDLGDANFQFVFFYQEDRATDIRGGRSCGE